MEKQQKVYVVMIDDADNERGDIVEFTVWSSQEKAVEQFNHIVESYKASFLNELIEQDEISFDSENSLKKSYILIETPEYLHFYEDGYCSNNHIEIWITEKVIDKENNQ